MPMHHDKIKIGDFIRKTREAAGLTQVELAANAKTTPRTISDLEGDKRRPRYEIFSRIIHALGVSADHIFWPDKIPCTPEQELLLRELQTCSGKDQSIFMDIAWAYIRAIKR